MKGDWTITYHLWLIVCRDIYANWMLHYIYIFSSKCGVGISQCNVCFIVFIKSQVVKSSKWRSEWNTKEILTLPHRSTARALSRGAVELGLDKGCSHRGTIELGCGPSGFQLSPAFLLPVVTTRPISLSW